MRQSCAATRSPAETEKPGFSQPKDGLIADGDLLGAIHRNQFNPRFGSAVPADGFSSLSLQIAPSCLQFAKLARTYALTRSWN